jgi:hypothetical protein
MTAAQVDRPLRGLVHAHTWHSFDSLLAPAAYLAYARRARLDFLAITDHNTLDGARELARLGRGHRVEIVIGAEYATDRGDVIGLFLTDDIASRRFDEVIAEIRAQGGLALLPHPYRGRDSDPERVAAVDLVETFNARSSADANASALADAERLGVPQVAGSDIHTAWELLRNGTLVTLTGTGSLRDRLLHAPRDLSTRSTARNVRRYSQVVKRIRARIGLGGHA